MSLELAEKSSEIQSFDQDKIRALLAEAESAMCESPNQVEIPIKHYFSKSVYAREMSMNKGEYVIGKIHKFENMHILSKGKITVFSIDGFKTLEAPATWVASAGSKRLIYAHEDTIWTTIHGTDETDLEKIEDHFIAKTYEDIPKLAEVLKIEGA